MADDAADRMVARAIESVLDQVPGSIDTSLPETGAAKLQPWAETAAPVGRNKRPLEELLQELEARVAAEPDARADVPRARHPALAFFDRFGRGSGRGQDGAERAAPGGESSGRRRRRRRGGAAGRAAGEAPQAAAPTTPQGDRPPSSGRRRRRGRGGGGGAASAPPGPPAAPRGDAGSQRPPGSPGGRRRRGRRGRGGGGGDGGPPAAG